ncbi:MAG: hypothetical protein ACI89W_000398 [Gammaproteobacteria bacterium]
MTQLLPTVIAGPILRHTDHKRIVWWLVTSVAIDIRPVLANAQNNVIEVHNAKITQDTFCVGQRAYIQLISIESTTEKPLIQSGCLYHYDFLSTLENTQKDDSGHLNTVLPLKSNASHANKVEPAPNTPKLQSILKAISHLVYEGHERPNFRFNHHLTKVTHGSCRKPHFHGQDALPQLDNLVADELANKVNTSKTSETKSINRPDLMLMTGDQVYVDDVAGPMLHAIHQAISLLGLHNERFEGATVDDLTELISHEHGFYQRELLLPAVEANDKLTKAFFAAKRKPVFTSVNAKNHLIALSEMLAMYLLTWSPLLWQFIDLEKSGLNQDKQVTYDKEKQNILAFQRGLYKVHRALAHVPSYMMFDDHDVTDDWNLTRGWEKQVYNHAFSKRIIGNAITAYFLCQGCGNPRAKIDPLFSQFSTVFSASAVKENTSEINGQAVYSASHAELINTLFAFDQWHYQLATQPPVHVLDTRTQRWRSESSLNKPSGLMDWEALCELQQSIIGTESVIMVSPAPVYGVKFIETIQKIFTIFGAALVVDAENWMAHRGTASVMLNIFRHIKTPPNFIILSGDVHYSFVYDVSLRFRRNSPHITQFTSSGLNNEFPPTLLKWFDRLNRWFYGHRSPLNWLTKRRNMSVRQRESGNHSQTLVNSCNIGVLTLNEDASRVDCALLCSDGNYISFSEANTQLKTQTKVATNKSPARVERE